MVSKFTLIARYGSTSLTMSGFFLRCIQGRHGERSRTMRSLAKYLYLGTPPSPFPFMGGSGWGA